MKSRTDSPVVNQSTFALVLLTLLTACKQEKEPTIISENPLSMTTETLTKTQSHISHIGVRTRINYEDFTALIREELPESHTDSGTERLCERVIGIKICGTAEWTYVLNRGDDIEISGNDNIVTLALPVHFYGTAGIQGDVAKTLKLSKLDFTGALDVNIHLRLDLADDWCPKIDTQVTYEWVQTPRVKWAGGLDLNIRKYLDDAINDQLDMLPEKITKAIDCDQFRGTLVEHWRSYNFPLDLSIDKTMYLNLTPIGFAFSGVHTETDSLGIAFTLEAKTAVEPTPIVQHPIDLPALEKIDYTTGRTEFELLVRAGYDQLTALAAPEVVGKTFTSETTAGPVSVLINSVELSGNNKRITIGIDFDANLPTTRTNTPGTVYLSATPVIQTQTQQISLTNIELTKVLDSKLWNLLASVFEQKIIQSIQKKAVWDLSPKIKKLEDQILKQLTDSDKTAGVVISASDIFVALMSLSVEPESLAAILHAGGTLDIVLPLAVITRH